MGSEISRGWRSIKPATRLSIDADSKWSGPQRHVQKDREVAASWDL